MPAACIFFYLSFSLFLFTAPPCLHHMAADQIMSNILPLQVFAICSFQTWDLLKAGVIIGMLYPLSFLSHRISVQLMLQREFHVITLALRRCPRERGTGKGDSRMEEETEAGGKRCMREKEHPPPAPSPKTKQKQPNKTIKPVMNAVMSLLCADTWLLSVGSVEQGADNDCRFTACYSCLSLFRSTIRPVPAG